MVVVVFHLLLIFHVFQKAQRTLINFTTLNRFFFVRYFLYSLRDALHNLRYKRYCTTLKKEKNKMWTTPATENKWNCVIFVCVKKCYVLCGIWKHPAFISKCILCGHTFISSHRRNKNEWNLKCRLKIPTHWYNA